MAISKKGKRRITVNNRKFLWWVYNEYDQTEFDGNQIKLISEDQAVYLKYGIEQEEEKRYLVVALGHNKYKLHLICPKFEDELGIIKPSGINKMITWASIYPNEENKREIRHAYSPQKGILKGTDRVKALEIVLDELNKNVDR